jgi:drug/metabolite transporter superfamily protein YnfA
MIRFALIIVAAVLLGIAAFSVWSFFQNPANIAWLATAAVSAVASAVLPSLAKRMSPEKEAEWRKRYLRGDGDKRR